MKLKHLWLKNFCQHADKQIELSNGLMGILGPNGSGKSNLINGIIYAITGTLPNNLAQYIKQGSEGGSFAQLTFVSDLTGMTYIIKRSLQPRRAELICVETNQTIRKSKDIDAFLTDVLHIDFNIIKNVLTVSQEDFVSFFRSTPSARAEILTRLFGFLELKTARESLRQILVSTKDDSENGAKLKAYKELLAEAERSLEPYKDVESKESLRTKILANIAESKRLAELSNLYTTINYFESQRAQKLQQIQGIQKQLESFPEIDLEALDNHLKELRGSIVSFSNAVQLGKGILQTADDAIESQKHYLASYQELQDTKKPLESDEEYEELEQRYHGMVSKLEDLQQFKSTGCCPTCGQPFPNLEAKLAEVEAEVNKVSASWRESTDIRNQYVVNQNTFKAAKGLYSDRYERLKNQITSVIDNPEAALFKELLEQLPPITKSLEEWVSALKAKFDEIQRFLDQVIVENTQLGSEYESKKQTADQRKSLDYQHHLLQRQLKELEENVPTIPEGSAAQEDIKALLEQLQKEYDALIKVNEEATRAKQLREQIQDLNMRIDLVEGLVKKDEAKLKYREVVSEVCDTLATDAFPKYVMIGLLEMLTSQINYYLTTFAAPFTVMIDNTSTELYCVFNNGETFMASELSGGQKMVLAISWRLALHNTFATEESCGFLTLDEPTNHLDENNIQNLTQVMAQVKEAARDRNLQVLVITHEKALEPLFDAVIRL